VGARVKVLSPTEQWRLCTIVASDRGQIKVHYLGFSKTHDVWLPKESPRIDEWVPKEIRSVNTRNIGSYFVGQQVKGTRDEDGPGYIIQITPGAAGAKNGPGVIKTEHGGEHRRRHGRYAAHSAIAEVELDTLALAKVREVVKAAEEKGREELKVLLVQAEEKAKDSFEVKMVRAREDAAMLMKQAEEAARGEQAREMVRAEEKARKEMQERVTALRRAAEDRVRGEVRARQVAVMVAAAAAGAAVAVAEAAMDSLALEWDEVGGFALNAAARAYCVARWKQEVHGLREGEEESKGGKLVKVDFEEIKRATENFSDRHLLGKGGCCRVFKAAIYGHVCAVKVFNELKGQEAWVCAACLMRFATSRPFLRLMHCNLQYRIHTCNLHPHPFEHK
jgi:hypothetical protein